MKKYIKYISLVLGSLFVAFVIIEIILRIIGWGQIVQYLPSQEWGYLMKPQQTVYSYGHPVHINKFGLRGPEIEQNKRTDTLRVLFVGDSITYGGARIRDENLFCRIVESMLKNNEKRSVESINLSAPGWSPQNWIKYIKLNGFLKADMVVMVLPETDLERKLANDKFLHDYHFNQPTFRIHTILWKMYIIIKSKVFPKSYKSNRWKGSNENQADPLELNLDAVLQLINLSKINKIELLVVLTPSNPPSKTATQRWNQFEKIIPNPLDLRDELNDASFFMDRTHLSVKGHKYVGKKIHERLSRYIR